MPKVSIIIPVYKVENYLDACVASVTAQTYRNLEILLIDDGSPDNCPALCDAWAMKDPRIRVIHQNNAGLSAARNAGIDASAGEYLLFVDSDDTIEADTVQRALEAQQHSDAELVIFNLVYVDENDQPIGKPDFSGFCDELLSPEEIWQRYFDLQEQRIYYVVAWNKLYKRELFKNMRFKAGKRYEDQFLMPELLRRCARVMCLSHVGYHYVQRKGSIMAQGNSRNYLDRPEYLLEWTNAFAAKGDVLRAEGLLNDAIQNLTEKDRFDLKSSAQRQRYANACGACAQAYQALARQTGKKSMLLRAALLRLGLPVYQAFLKRKH